MISRTLCAVFERNYKYYLRIECSFEKKKLEKINPFVEGDLIFKEGRRAWRYRHRVRPIVINT